MAECTSSTWYNGRSIAFHCEADLNCGAIMQDFDRDRVSRNRFEVMKSHEEEVSDDRRT